MTVQFPKVWRCAYCEGEFPDIDADSCSKHFNVCPAVYKLPGEYHDSVKSPKHYTSHPSGVECIQITEHMSFCLGNAIKYIWRADLKGGEEDLEKAIWYLNRELEKRKKNRP